MKNNIKGSQSETAEEIRKVTSADLNNLQKNDFCKCFDGSNQYCNSFIGVGENCFEGVNCISEQNIVACGYKVVIWLSEIAGPKHAFADQDVSALMNNAASKF
jgi:hypothetical protein